MQHNLMKREFVERWNRLTSQASDGEAVFDTIFDFYKTSHDELEEALKRVSSVLERIEVASRPIDVDERRYTVAFLAIWFHDLMHHAVQNCPEAERAEESAQLFLSFAIDFKDQDLAAEVAEKIRTTASELRSSPAMLFDHLFFTETDPKA